MSFPAIPAEEARWMGHPVMHICEYERRERRARIWRQLERMKR